MRISLAASLFAAALLTAACGPFVRVVGPPPDSDVPPLVDAADAAASRAAEAVGDPVLRKVEALDGGGFAFIFTDRDATAGASVIVADLDSEPSTWEVRGMENGDPVGRPAAGMDMTALRVGPRGALDAVAGEWPGCQPDDLTLFGEGRDLSWAATCPTDDGLAGTVLHASGGAS